MVYECPVSNLFGGLRPYFGVDSETIAGQLP